MSTILDNFIMDKIESLEVNNLGYLGERAIYDTKNLVTLSLPDVCELKHNSITENNSLQTVLLGKLKRQGSITTAPVIDTSPIHYLILQNTDANTIIIPKISGTPLNYGYGCIYIPSGTKTYYQQYIENDSTMFQEEKELFIRMLKETNTSNLLTFSSFDSNNISNTLTINQVGINDFNTIIEDSWAEIAENCQASNISQYNIGDIKPLTYLDNGESITLYMQIVAKEVDKISGTDNYAPLTWLSINCLPSSGALLKQSYNSNNTTSAIDYPVWFDESDVEDVNRIGNLRNIILRNLYNILINDENFGPNIIKPVTKTSRQWRFYNNNTYFPKNQTTDYLWIPSLGEFYADTGTGPRRFKSYFNNEYSESDQQFKYYFPSGSFVRLDKDLKPLLNSNGWWTRSISIDTSFDINYGRSYYSYLRQKESISSTANRRGAISTDPPTYNKYIYIGFCT